MKKNMFKKYFCLVVAMLFIIPTVTALNVGKDINQTDQKELNLNEEINEPQFIEDPEIINNVFSENQIPTINSMEVLNQNSRVGYVSSNMSDLFPGTILLDSDPFDSAVFRRENPSLFKTNPQILSSKLYKGDIIQPLYPQSSEPTLEPSSGSRSTRANEDDVAIWNMQWEEKNTGLCAATDPAAADNPDDPSNWFEGNQASIGSFFVGEKTTITITVKNKGTIPVSNVILNLSITDFIHEGQPMKQNPSTKIISSIGAGQNHQTTFDWTPPYATTSARIIANVDHLKDPDYSDNGLMTSVRVCKWWDDLESGVSSWDTEARTDINAGAQDDWGLTTSAHAQGDATHTTQNSWYEGNVDNIGSISDRYRDDNALSFESPIINLVTPGAEIDTRVWTQLLGVDTNGFKWYQYHTTCVGWVITGEAEHNDQAVDWEEYVATSDLLRVGEVSDDSGTTWGQGFDVAMGGLLGDVGETEWYYYSYLLVNEQDREVYRFSGVPFNYNVTNWNNVQFRNTFTSDDDSVNNIGYYMDDFCIFGNDNFTIPERVGITETTYPETNDVSILYKGSTASFSVTVMNFGKQHSFNVKMTVEDMDGNEEYSSTKSAGNLAMDDDKEVQFSWSPSEEGDFMVKIEAGDSDTDWTPSDNKDDFYVHVRSGIDASDVDVLVVDDDNSGGQNGLWRINTEDRMLQALEDNDLKYRVYTVGRNETGPTADIMDDYELVIWMTGIDNQVWAHGGKPNYNKNNAVWDITLKSDDMTELEMFLNNEGKKLWLISPGFIYDQVNDADNVYGATDFARNYLKISQWKANETEWNDITGDIVIQGTPNPLEGVEDTCMDDVEYATYDMPDPPFGFTDIGGMVLADDDGDEIFFQNDEHLQFNAISYQGEDYMAAYFAFNFYLISDEYDRADCVYKLLTSFGMTGGVLIEPYSNAEKLKIIYPGEEVSFRFKVANTGKKTDAMTLTVTKPKQYNDWQTWFEIDMIEKNTVSISGLNNKDRIYLFVKAPDVDDFGDYPKAGEKVEFTVKAVSENTGLDSSTLVEAQVPAIGNITMDCQVTEKSVDIFDMNKLEAKFLLELYNETNGEDDVDVTLSLSGDGASLAKFFVNKQESSKKIVDTILSPNEENDDIEVHVTPNEHSLAGWHNLTVALKNDIGDETFDEIKLSTNVLQFYQVECNTTGDEDGDINFIIDPNIASEDEVDYIKKTFTINVRNYGNGIDHIGLSQDKNSESDSMLGWPEPGIYVRQGGDIVNITSIEVSYYDENKKPTYGEEKVYFDIFIPIDADVGKYIIDFMIESSGTEIVGPGEEENNVVIFSFEIIKPNLVFTKLDEKGDPNFEFWDFEEALPIEEDIDFGDYYMEKNWNEFDLLTIEVKVYISNNGDTEVELAPIDIWLNITYIDEFGDTMYPYDGNLTPVLPTSAVTMPVGQEETFTFRWDPDTEPGSEPVEYVFMITVDPKDNTYEKNETSDNSAEFELFIKHIPKPKKATSSTPGFESVIMIAAIAVVMIGIGFNNRRRKYIR